MFQIKSKIIFGDYQRIKTELISASVYHNASLGGQHDYSWTFWLLLPETSELRQETWKEKAEDRCKRRRERGDFPTFIFSV